MAFSSAMKGYSMFHFTALVTCLSILLYSFTGIRVAKARATFGIKAPAITGNPDFERVFRVQMNTLEWMPIYLPALWLFAIYIGRDWPRLDRRSHPLHNRLFAGRRKTRTGLRDSGDGCGDPLAGRAGRYRLAPLSWMRIARASHPALEKCNPAQGLNLGFKSHL